MTIQKKARTKRVTKEDQEIGFRVFKMRLLKNRTKIDVAAVLDISSQQLGKYESGRDRISASQLKKIANYLQVDVNHFLSADMPANEPQNEYQQRILKLFNAIDNSSQKEAVVSLLESMSKTVSK